LRGIYSDVLGGVYPLDRGLDRCDDDGTHRHTDGTVYWCDSNRSTMLAQVREQSAACLGNEDDGGKDFEHCARGDGVFVAS
jgi:hypothetical protein